MTTDSDRFWRRYWIGAAIGAAAVAFATVLVWQERPAIRLDALGVAPPVSEPFRGDDWDPADAAGTVP